MTKKGFRSRKEKPELKVVLLSAQMPCPGCKANTAQGITAAIRAMMVTILLALSAIPSQAQSCISWQTILGEQAIDERATDISYSSGEPSDPNDPNFWVCGYQTSPYQTGADNSKNAWLLQINPQGEVINDFVINDSTELIASTLVHQNENIFVGGYYHTLNKPNEKKAWQALYNGSDIEWMFKSMIQGETKDILQLANGDMVTTGYIYFEDNLNTPNNLGKSLIIERWKRDGTLVWTKQYGGAKDEEGNALSLLNDNTILVTGFTSSSDGNVSNSIGGRDVWLLNINLNDGNIIQEKNFGGTSNDVAVDMVVLPNQQIAILAESLSNNGDISNSIGTGDFWLFTLDENWNIIWEKSYGGSDADYPQTMEVFPNGDLLIAGTSFSSNGNIATNYGFIDSWLAKIDYTKGSVIWSKVIGGDDADEIKALSLIDEHQIIAAGNTDSYNIQCKTKDNKHTNQNVWLLGLDELLLNTNELWEVEEVLFNYTIQSPYLHLLNNNLHIVEIIIIDITGRTFYESEFTPTHQQNVNFSTWQKGIYTLIYKNESGLHHTKKIALY